MPVHQEETMRSDNDIQRDILQELKWDPRLQGSDLAVGVRDGIVTLAGSIGSYADKWTAEGVASHVKGVRAIANDIVVRLPSISTRSDPEIARAALNALQWHTAVPEDRIQVKVDNGWVKLEGTVDWYYQRESAEHAIRHLTGVKGVSNLITVKARAVPSDVKETIKRALQRGAALDANRITVQVDGSKAVLRGTVRAYAEKLDAARAARNAPGVSEVDNQLTVDPTMFAGV
jgi:osmotically-inducible protein OsmY